MEESQCGGVGDRTRGPCPRGLPLLRVLLQQACQQGLGLGGQVLGEADLLHQDELKEALVVLVVEGQPAAHHLVHDHAQAPPVHRPAVVVVLQHLRATPRGAEEPRRSGGGEHFALMRFVKGLCCGTLLAVKAYPLHQSVSVWAQGKNAVKMLIKCSFTTKAARKNGFDPPLFERFYFEGSILHSVRYPQNIFHPHLPIIHDLFSRCHEWFHPEQGDVYCSLHLSTLTKVG